MINSQQFTIRLTDDQKTVLNRAFPDLTQREIFENVFNAFNNPKQSDNSDFIAEIQQLKDEKEVEIRCLEEVHESYTSNNLFELLNLKKDE